MECDGINRVDLLNAVLLHSVTFESIFLLLNFWFRIQVFHGNSAWYVNANSSVDQIPVPLVNNVCTY